MHIAAAHHARRQNREHQKWNMAGDYAINGILKNAGFNLPPGALTGYPGECSEAIYSKLPTPPPGKDGNADPDPGKCGEVRDAPGKDGKPASPAELAQAEAEAKTAIAQASQQAKAMGKLPGDLARLVGEILQPKIDWRDVLRRFVTQTAKNDYSWTPPNRRYIHQGIYLPSLKNQELGEIVVAIDTSGSVSSHQINEFSSELTAIVEETPATFTVIYCDSAIRNIETFTRDDLPITLNPVGGGGTSFIPPFEHVSENGIDPACLIYLTDGDCYYFPDNEPDYPVLWALTQKPTFDFPFGDQIIID
jgi:predicted metal-dependent peptidase